MRIRSTFIALAAGLLAASPTLAGGFMTGKNDPGNTVTFHISAPLETIVGTSAGVSGFFHFDPNDVKGSGEAEFTVDVTSFNTGIDLRDEHFRDNFLHTGDHPTATFRLDKITKASQSKVESGQSVDVEAEGTLTLHGVSRKEKVKATVTYLVGSDETKGVLPGNIVAMNASFRVALADYNIPRPEALFLKVGEAVDINLVTRLTDSADAGGGCCGCGGCGCGGCDGGKCGGGKCGGCGGCDGGKCGGGKCGGCDGCGGKCGGGKCGG